MLIKVGLQMKLGLVRCYWECFFLETLHVQRWLSTTNTFQNIFSCVGYAVSQEGLEFHGHVQDYECILYLFIFFWIFFSLFLY